MKDGLCLVKNNNARAAIIIPDEAIPPEQLAAEELQYHIQKAAGVKLSIHAEKDKPAGFDGFVYLGNCRKTAEAGINVAALPPSGYVIKTIDGNLFLAGKDRVRSDRDTGGNWVNSYYGVGWNWAAGWQGTLFAVYDLLENEMGVRWLWPGELGEIIPQTNEIKLGHIDRNGTPRFLETRLRAKYPADLLGWASGKNREKFLHDQGKFLLRHRFSTVQSMSYGHNFTTYWERFGKTHPEFFNMFPNGKRELLEGDVSGKNITMCVSQPALWKQIISDWEKSSDRNPTNIPYRPFINVCENDTPGMCACETCRSWDAPDPGFEKHDYWGKKIIPKYSRRFTLARVTWGEGVSIPGDEPPSLSDRYARFYLSVLNEAKTVDKDAKVIGYAYANYWKAPKSVKLNEDIIISYVPPLWFPYTEKQSREFRENWDGWIKSGVNKIKLRPNLTHAGANLPVFYAKRLAADFSYAATNGMMATGFDSLLGAWSAQGPTLYTLARIHEHPDWSADKILDEYYSGFGKAKEAVKRYFEYWEKYSDSLDPRVVQKYCDEERDSSGRPGGSFKNYVRIAHRLFPPEVFAEARKLMTAALESAKGDKLAEQRVAFLEKGLTDAEMTAATRAVQSKAEKEPGEENNRAFETAFKKLVDYRASVEADNVCNFGNMAFREKHGAGWKHK